MKVSVLTEAERTDKRRHRKRDKTISHFILAFDFNNIDVNPY